MYSGYRLKINGTVMPNKYIAKGTYSCTEAKRVVETWKDANQVEHQITTGTKKATISFSIISHGINEHALIMSIIGRDEEVDVEYYSDVLNTYKTARCRVDDITFEHLSTYGHGIQYAETPITLNEN